MYDIFWQTVIITYWQRKKSMILLTGKINILNFISFSQNVETYSFFHILNTKIKLVS